MAITATHVNYYHICHRKLWLFDRGIQMEHTSEVVDEGRLIHETSYARRSAKWQEINLGVAKIDFYDPQEKVIHEIKKSNKKEEAHIAQVKYYLYLLKEIGVDATAILEYPALRETLQVELHPDDMKEIEKWLEEIEDIVKSEECPGLLPRTKCSKCAYLDFCWSGEVEEKEIERD